MAKINEQVICELLNPWQELHEFLKKNNPVRFTDTISKIQELTAMSRATYYRSLSNPHNLSLSDKKAIAAVYELPAHFLFPELKEAA